MKGTELILKLFPRDVAMSLRCPTMLRLAQIEGV
jgi:hypothetical protein